jgi:hypothetical protein
MELDDLKTIWKKEITVQTQTIDFNSIRIQVDAYDRRAKIGWALELFACAAIVVAVGFGWFVIEQPGMLLQIGLAAMIISTLFVAAKIVFNRRITSVDNWTLLGKINTQIEKREKDAKLLNSVALWYLTPLFVAVVLSSFGGYAHRTGSYLPDAGLWIYWAVCLVLYIGIYFFNLHQVKTKIKPILNQLYTLRDQLNE